MLPCCRKCKTRSNVRIACSGCADEFCDDCFNRHECVLAADRDDRRRERVRQIKKEARHEKYSGKKGVRARLVTRKLIANFCKAIERAAARSGCRRHR